MKKNKEKYLIILIILFEFLFYLIENLEINNIELAIIPLILTIFSLFFIYNKKFPNKNNYIYLFIILGMFLKNMYVIYTDVYTRGHDIGYIYEDGHLGYIYTLYKTNSLPLTNEWQFYHPPLFHIISALFLKFNDIIGFSLDKGIEGIQYINIIISTFTMIVSYKIIDKLNIKQVYKYLINIFLNLFPTFVILVGSINNDCLVTFLEFLIILYLIRWYENDNIKNLVKLAIATGLCVMSKLNGATMAIPILFIFIKKFIYYIKLKDKNRIKKFILEMIIFGIISLPIGLWYQVRNIMLFGSNDVPDLGTDSWQYLGNHSYLERFFNISFSQIFNKIYCNPCEDYNIFAYIVKCSVFGEYSYNISKFISVSLLVLNLIIIFISLYSTFKYLFKYLNKNLIMDLLLFAWMTVIISFYIFNIKYPYGCTQDFRYIIISLLCGISFIFYDINYSNNKLYKKIISIMIILFSMFNFIFIVSIL